MTKCNCRKNIEERLLERFKASAHDATDHSIELQGYALCITDDIGIVTRPFMQFKATATHKLKNGGTKQKRALQNMMFNYCPFCGVKIEDSEKGGA